MKAFLCVVVVALCAGCATAPENSDPSVFDLIEESEFGPMSMDVCPSGGVKYCVGDGTTLDRCACADAFDVQKSLERAFW